MKTDLNSIIESALMYKPAVVGSYVVRDIKPVKGMGVYIGEDKEGLVRAFHEYKAICGTWYEAIAYEMDLKGYAND